MTALYLRKVIVTLSGAGGGLSINANLMSLHDLTVGFTVEKSVSGTPNTATISILNLAAGSRGKLKNEFDRVRLECGYMGQLGSRGNIGVIFDGFIRDVKHAREEASGDISSTIECGDGDKGFRQGVIAKTWPAGTKPRDIVSDLHAAMPDVDIGTIDGLDDAQPYRRPVTMVGPVRRCMDQIARTHRLLWSVQDGALEVIPADGYIDDVVLLSKETGLVGVPTVTDNGVQVRALLNPQIRVNRVIEVRSETLDMNDAGGRFRVSGLTFTGDNRDGEFIADITAERISDGRVPLV